MNTSWLKFKILKVRNSKSRSSTTFNVFPISFQEYLGFESFELKDPDVQRNEVLHHFNKYLFKGGFPEVVLEEDGYQPSATNRIFRQHPSSGHSGGSEYPGKRRTYRTCKLFPIKHLYSPALVKNFKRHRALCQQLERIPALP